LVGTAAPILRGWKKQVSATKEVVSVWIFHPAVVTLPAGWSAWKTVEVFGTKEPLVVVEGLEEHHLAVLAILVV